MMENEKISLLQQIFDNVNSWLHFIEAKNAALIAFDIAFVAAIVGIDGNWIKDYIWLVSLIIIGLALSMFFALWSFRPINTKLKATNIEDIEVNLIHYAYISGLEYTDYIKALYELYWNEPEKDINRVPLVEKHYCEEIIANSRIAMRKQKYFTNSFYIDMLIIIIFVLLIICA